MHTHSPSRTHLVLAAALLTLAAHACPAFAAQPPPPPPPPQLPAGSIFVISLPRCAARLAYHAHANAASARALPAPVIQPGVDFSTLSAARPPLPILFNERVAAPSATVRAGQVACTASHRAVWLAAARRNLSSVVILEDDVVLTAAGAAALPGILRDAHAGSHRRTQPWHYLFLRRTPVAWSWRLRASWHGRVRRSPPSWGTAAYALSWHGVRHMLRAVRAYEAPLDVTVARLQREASGTGFIALDACAGAAGQRCNDLTAPVPASAQGDCAFSATQAGWQARIDAFPCKLQI